MPHPRTAFIIAGFWFLALVLLPLGTDIRSAYAADPVDRYIELRMEREHIPGLSLVVIRGGKIIKAKGYGRASLELSVPTKPDTVYELASATKPLVALAVLLLVQEGKLSLEDRVSKFVEKTPDTWKEMTVRHLLSHTSGIKDYLSDLRQDFPQETPPERIVQTAMDAGLNFSPGEKWAYSNTGYILLGMILHKASGKTYDILLQERVFKPLGMTQSRRDSPDEVVPNHAVGYLWYGGAFHNAEFLKFLMTNHGDRGILSTALDLAKWDDSLASDRLLSADSKKAMWTPTILKDGSKTEYGLGWFVKNINGHRQVSHPGGAPGTAAILSRYLDDDLTVILLANGGRPFMQILDLGVARYYIPSLVAVKTVRVSPALLDAYAGYYNAYGSQILKVLPTRSGLYLDDNGGLNNDLLPVADTQFVTEEGDRSFDVTRNAKGEVTGAMLRLGVDKMAVQRIGPLARTLRTGPDPDPEGTKTREAVLKAFALGGKAVEEVPGLSPQARKDYSRGPSLELAGIRSISYIATQDVAAQQIERHGAKVSRILYYTLLTEQGKRFVLVYLTADGLVTDQDVVQE